MRYGRPSQFLHLIKKRDENDGRMKKNAYLCHRIQLFVDKLNYTTMKKVYLMKGLAVMAMGLVIASCSKDVFDPNALQAEKQEEFNSNFQKNVLNGQEIDANQTWSTAAATEVTVKSDFSGTLKIFCANPIGEDAAALYSQDITAGTYTITVTKPADEENLYAALIDADGSLQVMEFTNNVANFSKSTTNIASVSKRAQKKYGKDFPDQPSNADYKTTYPTGTQNFYDVHPDGYEGNSAVYYVTEDCTNKKIQINTAKNSAVYVVSSNGQKVTAAPNYFYMPAYFKYWNGSAHVEYPASERAHLYICPNVTFKLSSNDSGNLQAGLMIYVAEGAVFEAEGELKLNSCAIYNKGTVKAPKISSNGDGILYNQGTVTVTGNVEVTNANTAIVNESRLSIGGNFNTAGSGSFWNVSGGTTTVSGQTILNSNDNGWINDGLYTTRDFMYTAGSPYIWNNCKLTVNKVFSIVLGSTSTNGFFMDGNASVVADSTYYGANARIIMGTNSIFKTRIAVMNSTCNGCVDGTQGIYGPSTSGNWAVFQAGTINCGPAGKSNTKYVAYVNNLYVASDSHFANFNDGQYNGYYIHNGAKLVNGQTSAPITIPANGNCSAGYSGGSTVVYTPNYIYYAFEDLGTTDDFDFNDVVIRVSAPSNGESTVDLCAAGGTMQTYVTYGDGNNPPTLGSEVHSVFGSYPTKTMINTNATDGVNGISPKYLATISVAGKDISNLPLGIKADGSYGSVKVVRSVAGNGNAPLVIVVSGNSAGKWYWPKERVNISTAYSQFGAWGTNASTNTSWYQNSTSGQVYTW